MSMKLMVLGAMHRQKQRQAHGYQIYHDLVLWRAETWTKIRPGSIYHALVQLEKEGMLMNLGEESGQKGSSKTIYKMTAKGEEELVRLVEEALVSYDQEIFTAGLAFMSVLARQRVVELAKERLRNHKDTVVFLSKLPRNDTPATPEQHAAIISSWSAVFSSTTKWQNQFLRDLQNGVYMFTDDK